MYRKVLTIIDNPKALRQNSEAFSDFESWTTEDSSCLKDLTDTFSVLQGLGLAAPQIGIFKRAIVVNLKHLGLGDSDSALMVNPTIETSGATARSKEACFSVPYVDGFVERPQSCVVSYIDETGSAKEITATGYAAVCLQHEIDHLDGVLYIDRMGSLSRRMVLKKVEKSNKKKLEAARLAKQAFDEDHRDLTTGPSKKKTTYSKKRKPKARKKRQKKSKKR